MSSSTGLGELHHARQRRGGRRLAGRLATRVSHSVSRDESRTAPVFDGPSAGCTDEPDLTAIKRQNASYDKVRFEVVLGQLFADSDIATRKAVDAVSSRQF